MKNFRILPIVLLAACATGPSMADAPRTLYINPLSGDDAGAGTSAQSAWKSFDKLATVTLGPGDKVVVAPGVHPATLHPTVKASAAKPATIEFLPGIHEFAVEKAIRRPLYVSNSCDAPQVPKPFGILVENCAHLRLQGAGVAGDQKTTLLMGGRMIEAANLNSEDIAYQKLVFDLKRPAVSEFRVMEASGDTAVLAIAEGSTYAIKDGKFRWTGDLGIGDVWTQEAIPAEGRCWRMKGFNWNPFPPAVATELAPGKVRLEYPKGKGHGVLVPGHQYHFRHAGRDSVGIHNARSKDIVFEDCDVYALTNMGFVSQFTENITVRRVRVAPPEGTLRTCPGWADLFQFSNCKGLVLVEDSLMSGMQDDAVNCHGTHLRIVGKPAENQLKLRYMHRQTYGFQPYVAGDAIAVVDHNMLRELPGNPRRRVTACEKSDADGREWTVTLDGPAPAFAKDDVVDNLSWHPDLTLRNNRITMAAVRGFLITTRGKVLVEGNTFHHCYMPGILIEDDARGWYESTCIRDMVIRRNTFVGCGIDINPQTASNNPKEPVHENIRIEDNTFDDAGIVAKGVKGLVITGNKTPAGGEVPAKIAPSCSEVTRDEQPPGPVAAPVAEPQKLPACVSLDGKLADPNLVDKSGHIVNVAVPRLRLLRTAEPKAKGSVLILPSGGYHVLSVVSDGVEKAKFWNGLGYDAAILEYTLSPKGWNRDDAVRDAALKDAQAAAALLRTQGEALGLHGGGFILMGHSAGGHLATRLVASLPEKERPDTLVLFYPAYLEEAPAGAHAGGMPVPKGKLPHLLEMVATQDNAGWIAGAKAYGAAWEKAGGPVKMETLEGNHGFLPGCPAAKQWPDKLKAFMAKP